MKILFQGDSLTDSGRNKEIKLPNVELGNGYVNIVAEKLILENKDIEIFNRGVYGDKITDMYARWRTDTLNMDYNILSILCGVNDVGFERRMKTGNDIEKYEFVYDRLLLEAKRFNSEAKMILIAPFLFKMRYDVKNLGCDIYNDWEKWENDIINEGLVVQRMAKKYNADFIPMFDIFKDLCKVNSPEKFSVDCIHLTSNGSEILADYCLNTIRKYIWERIYIKM